MMPRSTAPHQKRVPRATYRLQFNREFTLQQAEKLIPYLHELGVSHVYASPLLKACSGSLHGYDVCDCSQINPEIGTEAELESFVGKLHQNGMGLVLDMVPNHMAASSENPWWWDALKHGRNSRYANHFDIDWNSPDPNLKGKVLVPVLGDECERVVEQNQLNVEVENGKPILRYFEHKFPLSPDSYSDSPARLISLNTDPQGLKALLEKQHYRLAFWRHGDSQINYRRFFNISTLAGLRVEDPQVFHDTHALVLKWYQRGWLDGLRIDHPDGLRDPQAYLARLRQAAPDAWIIVEKILEPGESLPADWPVAGTTGYEFLNRNGGLFIHSDSEKHLTEFYHEFTGEPVDYPAMVRQKKLWALNHLLSSEVNRLLHQWRGILLHSTHTDQFTKPSDEELRETLCALIACLPVYRTYIQAGQREPSTSDQHWLQVALNQALAVQPRLNPDLLAGLVNLLQSNPASELETDFIMRFQQLAGPAMAKGVEDTSFYCFNRFVALNEVGGDPGHFGLSPEAFHQNCVQAAKRWPDAMLASSTHDTKRSEDVRARLALLSEIPEEWTFTVRRWSAHNEPHRRNGFPDRNAEYLFYQSLVGAWPLSAERAVAYMKKASCEAKQHTNWTAPNPAYDEALKHFITATMNDQIFMADVERLVSPLITAGHVNSLAQTLIKLMAPGVPDIYQGNELWDLSLVDPDNRRPVDFELRQQLLKEAPALSAETVWSRRQEGLPKLWLILKALACRARYDEIFRSANNYLPLSANGAQASRVVAFARGNQMITIAPRLTLSLENDWAETIIQLPAGEWFNELTGENLEGNEMMLAKLLERFPVALLTRHTG